METDGAGGCERFRPLVAKYDWDVDIAMAVMKAESDCDPNRYNGTLNTDGTNDAGLMQVNSRHDPTSRRYDPGYNIALSYKIYRDRKSWETNGWKAWSSCFNSRVKCY